MSAVLRLRSPVAVLTACVAAAALVLGVGVDSAEGGSGDRFRHAGGPSVPFGASPEQWRAAFAGIEPVELVLQSASSAASSGGKRETEMVEEIERLSGGKVSIELVFGDAIAPNVEADQAMTDGRIDLHLLVPFLQPSDFPVSGRFVPETTATRDSSLIAGSLASFGALNEALWQEPGLFAEYEALGLTVLAPMPIVPNVVLACSQPLRTLEDLAGKQVRVGPAGTFAQIEALGATPVSVAFADLFESLQRGIVDCMVIGFTTMTEIPGMVELVPYLMTPIGTSFIGTPAVMLAGTRWPDLPLAVQQLIFDAFTQHELANTLSGLGDGRATTMVEQARAAGGGVFAFADDVNRALKAHNDAVAARWRENPDIDGAAFEANLDAAYEKWHGLVAEAGYSGAEIPDVDGWGGATPDWTAFTRLYEEHVAIPHRPR